MSLRVAAIAVACVAPVVARAEPPPATPSYVPRAHPPGPGRDTPDASDGYFYVAFGQSTPMAGAGAMITQAQPLVSTVDFHSLAEISVESSDGRQIIEIGWNVDPGVNGESVEPHLFVFHWINGQGTCYNGCGWVPNPAATHAAGMEVPADKLPHAFQIEHRADARWWLTYDGDDLGYFPDSEWSGTYTEGGFTQWFGEVAAGAETDPCTEMGDGMAGTSPAATSYAGIYTIAAGSGSGSASGSGNAHVPGDVQMTALTNPAAYTAGAVTPTGFRFGGFGIANPSCQYYVDAPPDAAFVDGPPGDAGNAEMGEGGGCCDAGAHGGASSAVLALLVVLGLRPRSRDSA